MRLADVRPVHVADVLVEGEPWPGYLHVVEHPGGRILVDTGMIDSTPELDEDWHPTIYPERIPFGYLSRALSAVQRLAAGPEAGQEEDEQSGWMTQDRLLLARPLGIDVYSGDGNPTWSTVKANGYTFAWIKATEGFTFNDSNFRHSDIWC